MVNAKRFIESGELAEVVAELKQQAFEQWHMSHDPVKRKQIYYQMRALEVVAHKIEMIVNKGEGSNDGN
jgi:hypothetical protein